MKFLISTPLVSLLQFSTSLLLLVQTLHNAEARLMGGRGANTRSNTNDDNIHHNQQQGAYLLDRKLSRGIVYNSVGVTIPSNPVNCLGSCSINQDKLLRQKLCYDLTQDIKGDQGAIWFQDPYNVSLPFHVKATIYVGNKEGGGDGMAFVIQPNSANEYPIEGSGGGGLGYKTIHDALAVEIDTYKDDIVLNDHLEVKYTSPSWTSLGRTELASDIESKDQDILLEIEWTAEMSPGRSNFFVRLGDEGVFEAELSSISEYLGNATTAYFGFTAATGARHNLQYVCPGSVSVGELPQGEPVFSPPGEDTGFHGVDEEPVVPVPGDGDFTVSP